MAMVYVLTGVEHLDYRILGVFSTLAAADAAYAAEGGSCVIEGHTVDRWVGCQRPRVEKESLPPRRRRIKSGRRRPQH